MKRSEEDRMRPLFTKVGKTLYHGTILDQMDGIKRFGLVPGGLDGSAGRFTSEMYELEGGEGLDAAVFMAGKGELEKAFGAMKFSIARKLGKEVWEVGEEDIEKEGLIVVVRDEDDYFDRVPEGGMQDPSKMHFEPGDFYSEGVVESGYFLKGKGLIRFLRRAGLIKSNNPPLVRGLEKDLGWMRQRLIYLARKAHPEQEAGAVAEKVKGLEKGILESYLKEYEKWFGERKIGGQSKERKLIKLGRALNRFGFRSEAGWIKIFLCSPGDC